MNIKATSLLILVLVAKNGAQSKLIRNAFSGISVDRNDHFSFTNEYNNNNQSNGNTPDKHLHPQAVERSHDQKDTTLFHLIDEETKIKLRTIETATKLKLNEINEEERIEIETIIEKEKLNARFNSNINNAGIRSFGDRHEEEPIELEVGGLVTHGPTKSPTNSPTNSSTASPTTSLTNSPMTSLPSKSPSFPSILSMSPSIISTSQTHKPIEFTPISIVPSKQPSVSNEPSTVSMSPSGSSIIQLISYPPRESGLQGGLMDHDEIKQHESIYILLLCLIIIFTIMGILFICRRRTSEEEKEVDTKKKSSRDPMVVRDIIV